MTYVSGPNGSYGLDIDLEDDEEADVRPLGRPQVVFDAEQRAREQERRMQQQRRAAAQAAVRPVDTGDQTDTWASLG
ncbi:hypothetical protein M407DRAFT_17441 [Tulasnella calospora MUT 4182]|uniref:Uncharacterized protein n=1 Tax=Tulasnella calospora MUT 4182 TaxID=1051891 RepID=A0A0C3QLZ0_9AGAM|nr:hypothetical protein M407DRAFT_17441 [Tulasnella calospora MUT 4182]